MILPGWISETKNSGLPLPLPMRTSAGFCETGLSGNTRIQMRPPRLMWRDIARRAASSCLAVSRPRVVALRPNSPNATLVPREATPVLRPFCCLRYLVLAGCSMTIPWFLRLPPSAASWAASPWSSARGRRPAGGAPCARLGHRLLGPPRLRGRLGLRRRRGRRQCRLHLALRHDFALVDPHLDADHAE